MCLKLTVSSPDPMASSSAASAICLLKSGRRCDAGTCGSMMTSSKLAENFCSATRWVGRSARWRVRSRRMSGNVYPLDADDREFRRQLELALQRQEVQSLASRGEAAAVSMESVDATRAPMRMSLQRNSDP